jgi:hypothetical protein
MTDSSRNIITEIFSPFGTTDEESNFNKLEELL